MYFYYLYKLREAQRQPAGQAPFLLREDLQQMDAISEQAKFLRRHGIDSEEKLISFRVYTEQQIVALTEERKNCQMRSAAHLSPRNARWLLVSKLMSFPYNSNRLGRI